MSAQANATTYRSIVADFKTDGSNDITRWILISKGHPVGVFNSHTDANKHLVKMLPEEKDSETLILPFFYKVMYGTEVNPNWSKETACATIKRYLTLQDFTPSWAKVGYVELMFLYMMQVPELVSQHPRFYKTVVDKIAEFSEEIRAMPHKFQQSRVILVEMPRFIKFLKDRTDFVAPKEDQPRKRQNQWHNERQNRSTMQHNYMLRSRNNNNRRPVCGEHCS